MRSSYLFVAAVAVCGIITGGLAYAYGASSTSGFAFGVSLPKEQWVLDNTYEASGRGLMTAVFRGDKAVVRHTLEARPSLAFTASGTQKSEIRFGLLEIAIARQDKEMVNLLLSEHVAPNFPEQYPPLGLALAANDRWYAVKLLDAGASPNPTSASSPYFLSDAAGNGDLSAMRILFKYSVDLTGERTFGRSALVNAVDHEEFRAAEFLIDKGESIWEIEPRAGQSLAAACSREDNIHPYIRHYTLFDVAINAITNDDLKEELAARKRVKAKLESRGYPCPAPTKGKLAQAVLAGEWPPAAAQHLGAPLPSATLKVKVALYWNPDGTRKRLSPAPATGD